MTLILRKVDVLLIFDNIEIQFMCMYEVTVVSMWKSWAYLPIENLLLEVEAL